MSNICVLGSGTWGTSIAQMLAENGHSVNLWSYFEEESLNLQKTRSHPFLDGLTLNNTINFTSDMALAASGAEIIVIATPSHTVRQTAKTLGGVIKQEQTVLSISKGLEENSLKRLSEVIRDEIADCPLAVMSGPSHAEEVARKLPTTNVVASEDIAISQRIQDVFMNPFFRVYTGNDIIGIEIGAAMKNVISICAGISDGLGFGDNAKAALMTRGIAEISRLGIAMGGKPETFAGLAGIGDLIVTCTSPHSRNRRAGILIGGGMSAEQAIAEVKMVVEGIRTTRAGFELARKYDVDMPIVTEAYRVLFEGKNPREAVPGLMMRQKTHETEGFL